MLNQRIYNKAKKIKLVLTDIDGVLTNGGLCYGPSGDEYKIFHVRDGLGMQLLEQHGINVGILTGKDSLAGRVRALDLKVSYAEFGLENKLSAYENIIAKAKVTDTEVAYIGDDIPDLAILSRVGLSATVADAPFYIKNQVDLCLTLRGGEGAFRELGDLILQAQGKLKF